MTGYTTPPTTISVGGRDYMINTDFRVWLQFQADVENAKKEEIVDVVQRFLKSQNLPICEETFEKVLYFFTCGKSKEEKQGGNGSQPKEKAVDFATDEPLIFSAFLAQYGINLRITELHFWDFMAMFQGLSEDHLIVKIMGYRIADTSKMIEPEKTFYTNLKKKYALEQPKKAPRNADELHAEWKAKVAKIAREVNGNE